MNPSNKYFRIFAFDPCQAGFGFIVLEGGSRLVDWGIAQVWSKAEAALLNRIEQFVGRYSPSLFVVEDAAGSRLGRAARRKIEAVTRYAEQKHVRIVHVSRKTVKEVFMEAGRNKQQIAAAIVEAFPELRPRLPDPRKLWKTEDPRMHIFDALSLALALPQSN